MAREWHCRAGVAVPVLKEVVTRIYSCGRFYESIRSELHPIID